MKFQLDRKLIPSSSSHHPSFQTPFHRDEPSFTSQNFTPTPKSVNAHDVTILSEIDSTWEHSTHRSTKFHSHRNRILPVYLPPTIIPISKHSPPHPEQLWSRHLMFIAIIHRKPTFHSTYSFRTSCSPHPTLPLHHPSLPHPYAFYTPPEVANFDPLYLRGEAS